LFFYVRDWFVDWMCAKVITSPSVYTSPHFLTVHIPVTSLTRLLMSGGYIAVVIGHGLSSD
jgi:hypothetical protein